MSGQLYPVAEFLADLTVLFAFTTEEFDVSEAKKTVTLVVDFPQIVGVDGQLIPAERHVWQHAAGTFETSHDARLAVHTEARAWLWASPRWKVRTVEMARAMGMAPPEFKM